MDEFSFVPVCGEALEYSPDVPAEPQPSFKMPLIPEDSTDKLAKLFSSLSTKASPEPDSKRKLFLNHSASKLTTRRDDYDRFVIFKASPTPKHKRKQRSPCVDTATTHKRPL